MARTTRRLNCAECGKSFEAQSPRAMYCGATCKKRVNRRPSKVGSHAQRERADATADRAPAAPAAPPSVGGLISQVAADLAKLEVLDTIPGRAALALAYRIESPQETGSAAASMTKELSRLVEEAKALTPKQQDGVDDLDDTVAQKLRLVR